MSDRSIVYTDHVLSELINACKSELTTFKQDCGICPIMASRQVSMAYIYTVLHYAIAPSQQTHVPMLMWFSDTWQKKNSRNNIACLVATKKPRIKSRSSVPKLIEFTWGERLR